ncbi:hypothetical protein [Amycolatopsis sp. NPDC059657]|uniref:hypothetical protein n=1 Tax=Amycolatopsis sp. NPDC059657 TaxID=3346899 RepID=UPI00366D19AB
MHGDAPDHAVWCYDQPRRNGAALKFSGYIRQIHGAEAERLSGRLATVIGDLLRWADERSRQESTEDEPA